MHQEQKRRNTNTPLLRIKKAAEDDFLQPVAKITWIKKFPPDLVMLLISDIPTDMSFGESSISDFRKIRMCPHSFTVTSTP